MAQLAVETWRQIVMNHLQTKDCLSLSTTSSHFCALSKEVLYNEVDLLKWSDGGEKDRRRELFARSLKERPALAALVHSLRLGVGFQQSDCYLHHPILYPLSSFPLLRYLKVDGVCVGREFLAALQSHPRLTHIEFESCSIDDIPPGTVDMQAWSGATISKLGISSPSSQNLRAWLKVFQRGIRSLTFAHPSEAHIGKAFSNLPVPGITPTLTSLSLESISLPPSIVSILASCPQLHRLCLRVIRLEPARDSALWSELTSDIIPFLEDFTGPTEFLENIVRGRPVHTVKPLFSTYTPIDILVALQLSAVPVRTIILGSLGYHVPDLYECLMHSPVSVTHLAWEFRTVFQRDAMSYITPLSRLSNLTVMKGSMFGTPMDQFIQSTDLIRQYATACPSIEEFDFIEERWLRRKDGSWERWVPCT